MWNHPADCLRIFGRHYEGELSLLQHRTNNILYLNDNGQVHFQVPALCQALRWSAVIYSLSLLQTVTLGKTWLRQVESFLHGYWANNWENKDLSLNLLDLQDTYSLRHIDFFFFLRKNRAFEHKIQGLTFMSWKSGEYRSLPFVIGANCKCLQTGLRRLEKRGEID